MIQLDHITWKTGDRVILADVTIAIPANTYAVLMGSTGCGKTTLLEILCGLRQSDFGARAAGWRGCDGPGAA
jgi:molybdate/tungstate transport system ATP-binding protein